MARDSVKHIEQADPLLREKVLLALANPGKIVVVEELSEKLSAAMMYKLRAIRKGFIAFEPHESERFLAAQNNRLHFNREWYRERPGLHTVTIRYEGRILRPSEEAAAWLQELKRKQSYGE